MCNCTMKIESGENVAFPVRRGQRRGGTATRYPLLRFRPALLLERDIPRSRIGEALFAASGAAQSWLQRRLD